MTTDERFLAVNSAIKSTNSLVEYQKRGTINALYVVNDVGHFVLTYKGKKVNDSYGIHLTYPELDRYTEHQVAELKDYCAPLVQALTDLINNHIRTLSSESALTKSRIYGLNIELPRSSNQRDMDNICGKINQLLRHPLAGELHYKQLSNQVSLTVTAPIGEVTQQFSLEHGFIVNTRQYVQCVNNEHASQIMHKVGDLLSSIIFINPSMFETARSADKLRQFHNLNIKGTDNGL